MTAGKHQVSEKPPRPLHHSIRQQVRQQVKHSVRPQFYTNTTLFFTIHSDLREKALNSSCVFFPSALAFIRSADILEKKQPASSQQSTKHRQQRKTPSKTKNQSAQYQRRIQLSRQEVQQTVLKFVLKFASEKGQDDGFHRFHAQDF